MFPKILQRIVDQTAPARLPKPWHFLIPVPSVRVLGIEPSVLVTSLLSEFPENELINAQILLRVSECELRLTPVLDATAPVKVLSRDKDGEPCDFEHEQGRLTPGDPAALRCLDDHLTRERSAKCNFVLATFSNADLAVLSMLGLPATPAWGLSSITAEQARCFFPPPKESIGVLQQSGGSPQLPEERPRIILAATELRGLRNQLPVGFLPAASQFQRIERTMKRDTASNLGIWLPSPADYRHIRDGVALADRQLVFKAINRSVRSSVSIEQYFKSTSAPVADDIPRARRKLHDAINNLTKSPFGTRDLPARLDVLNRAFEIAIIERTNHEAMVAADPLDKSLWSVAAQLMEMQFESSELVQRTRAAIATGRAENVDTPVEDRLHFQLRLADGLIRIKKAIAMNK